MHAVLAKPRIDTRGNDKVVSRIGMERETDFTIGKNETFIEHLKNMKILLVW